MNKRRLKKAKVNRPLSRRGKDTGKPGGFVGMAAMIGKAAGAIGGGITGSIQKKNMVEEYEEDMAQQGADQLEQQEISDTYTSQDVLATYNPQGDAQMYAKLGAAMYEEGGKMTPYPYQDQPRTMINPTTMFKNGGKTLLQMVQAGNPNAYWPKNNDNNLNNPAHVRTHRDNQDPQYYGSSQNQSNFKQGGTLLQRVQTGDTNNYWPDNNDNSLNNPAHVRTHRDNMDPRYYGSSQNQNNFQIGGNMYDELQQVGMEEYQAYQNGGAAQVPGGQLEELAPGAQEVKGDNPGVVDDVELGTNPGEPNAVVDDNEVIREAVDEQGQPYKQIFSDTVIAPGESKSMAKKAKSYLKQMPDDPESKQAQRLNEKLDGLFETQQMLNGDSHGETAEEAAAGGMDPNAAMQMEGEGQGAFQGGGAGYPSASYDAALREQQMQVPYPKKNYKKGGFGTTLLEGLGGAAEGFMPGYGMGSAFTDDFYGDKNVAAGVGSAASLAQGIPKDIASHTAQSNNQAMQEEVDQTNRENEQEEMDAQMKKAGGGVEGLGYQQMGNLQPPAPVTGLPGSGSYQQYQQGYQYGGEMYDDQMSGGGRAYQDGGMMIMIVEAQPIGGTLADLQAYSKPENWGTLDEKDNLRQTSLNMGREHRGMKHDMSSPVSGSERGGPTPKKKSFRNGGRLYYGHSLYNRSLTLSII